jgi:cell division protein FtsB
MSLAHELRRRSRHAIVPVLSACAIGYFGYHLVQGDYGLIAWVKLAQEIETTKAERARVAAQRDELAHRVALLRPSSLDPDLLDERARATLGFAHKNDVIILNAQQ